MCLRNGVNIMNRCVNIGCSFIFNFAENKNRHFFYNQVQIMCELELIHFHLIQCDIIGYTVSPYRVPHCMEFDYKIDCITMRKGVQMSSTSNDINNNFITNAHTPNHLKLIKINNRDKMNAKCIETNANVMVWYQAM